jgi:NitT/TauT family transport system substrate-binding protein
MVGQVEMVMTRAVPLVATVANGVPVVAVLGAEGHVAPPTTGLMVTADSPIKAIADLKGKRIGMPGIASPQGLATLLAL